MAHRAFIVWRLLTPDLAKTSNVKNYTIMASKSDNLRNLDFRAEPPQTMPHNNNDIFFTLLRRFQYTVIAQVLVSLNARPHKQQRLITIVLK